MKFALFQKLKKINDIYFISEKIKEINKNYELFYNESEARYEVHNLDCYPSLCVTFEHYPDYRLYKKLLLTNSKNINKIVEEIELSNNKLIENEEQNLIDKANQEMKEIFRYSQTKTDFNITEKQIKNIITK